MGSACGGRRAAPLHVHMSCARIIPEPGCVSSITWPEVSTCTTAEGWSGRPDGSGRNGSGWDGVERVELGVGYMRARWGRVAECVGIYAKRIRRFSSCVQSRATCQRKAVEMTGASRLLGLFFRWLSLFCSCRVGRSGLWFTNRLRNKFRKRVLRVEISSLR